MSPLAGHPLPFSEKGEEEDGKGDRDPQQWSWLPLYTAIAVLAYLLTSTVEPVPEISFPFFLQHMLYAGEVRVLVTLGPPLTSDLYQVHHLVVNSQRDRVFVYLHSGAIINGWEVRVISCHSMSCGNHMTFPQARRYGPQFMFTISGVDSLETRLHAAQEELGVPPSNWVPVTYKAQSDTL